MTSALPPLQLTRRLGVAAPPQRAEPILRVALTAEERTRLRGQRRSLCGRDLLLQLPRGEVLEPGEWLGQEDGLALVQVVPAEEELLVVRAEREDGFPALLQAAYHLGNRHVALELHTEELRLLLDPVLEQLLRQRGLQVSRVLAPFHPEGGAYGPPHSGSHHHGKADASHAP